MGARYYAPWTCKFISVDPKAAKYAHQSSYCYADNNPVMKNDPSGMGPGGDGGKGAQIKVNANSSNYAWSGPDASLPPLYDPKGVNTNSPIPAVQATAQGSGTSTPPINPKGGDSFIDNVGNKYTYDSELKSWDSKQAVVTGVTGVPGVKLQSQPPNSKAAGPGESGSHPAPTYTTPTPATVGNYDISLAPVINSTTTAADHTRMVSQPGSSNSVASPSSLHENLSKTNDVIDAVNNPAKMAGYKFPMLEGAGQAVNLLMVVDDIAEKNPERLKQDAAEIGISEIPYVGEGYWGLKTVVGVTNTTFMRENMNEGQYADLRYFYAQYRLALDCGDQGTANQYQQLMIETEKNIRANNRQIYNNSNRQDE